MYTVCARKRGKVCVHSLVCKKNIKIKYDCALMHVIARKGEREIMCVGVWCTSTEPDYTLSSTHTRTVHNHTPPHTQIVTRVSLLTS